MEKKMTLNEIEKKANYFEGKTLNTYTTEEVNKKILEILNKCIKNNIKIELTEKDFIKIVNIYYELYNTYNPKFLRDIADNSINKLDFYKIIKKLNLI